VTNLVLDDSRRIGDLLDEKIPLEGRRDAYKALVVEKYSDAIPTKEEDAVKFVESNFEKARESHWTQLSRKMGENFIGIFMAGYTNPNDQNLMGNISVDVGICDTMDLSRMRHPSEYHSLLAHAFGGLMGLYETSGHEKTDFFKSKYLRMMLDGCFGEKEGGKLFASIKKEFDGITADKYGVKSLKAVGLITDEFVRLAGSDEKSVWQMNDLEFLGFIEKDDGLMKRIEFKREWLDEFRRAMNTGGIVDRTDAGGIKLANAHEELEYFRSHADMQLRSYSAMTITERGHEVRREYERKFGPLEG
jgi:hypothetical protein